MKTIRSKDGTTLYVLGGENEALAEPARPTDAVPGSEAKIRVMTRRNESGERLHHPADLRLTSSREDDPVNVSGLGELLAQFRLIRVRKGRGSRRASNRGDA